MSYVIGYSILGGENASLFRNVYFLSSRDAISSWRTKTSDASRQKLDISWPTILFLQHCRGFFVFCIVLCNLIIQYKPTKCTFPKLIFEFVNCYAFYTFQPWGSSSGRRLYIYRMAHEKPARRLVEQRGRRSRNLYRKLNKCKCKVLTG